MNCDQNLPAFGGKTQVRVLSVLVIASLSWINVALLINCSTPSGMILNFSSILSPAKLPTAVRDKVTNPIILADILSFTESTSLDLIVIDCVNLLPDSN